MEPIFFLGIQYSRAGYTYMRAFPVSFSLLFLLVSYVICSSLLFLPFLSVFFLSLRPPFRPFFRIKFPGPEAHHTEEVGMRTWCKRGKKKKKKYLWRGHYRADDWADSPWFYKIFMSDFYARVYLCCNITFTRTYHRNCFVSYM